MNDPYPTSVTAIGAGISDAAKETSPIQQATIRLNKVVGRLEDTVPGYVLRHHRSATNSQPYQTVKTKLIRGVPR